MVKVRFLDRDPRVLPDMSARVAFLSRPLKPGEHQPLVAIPTSALARRDGRQVAFVVAGGKLREIPVAAGRRIGELIAVSGPEPGQQVVLHPHPGLSAGMAVTVAKK
jgi:multidrug efflux pump subunit AcrA (membrane-fusion protein)